MGMVQADRRARRASARANDASRVDLHFTREAQCQEEEKEKRRGRGDAGAMLSLQVLEDLQAQVGHLDFWEGYLLPNFANKCLELKKFNRVADGDWDMVPVRKLFTDNSPGRLDR